MKSLIRLFKSIPVKEKDQDIHKQQSKDILKKTIERGFIFSQDVIDSYSDKELLDLIKTIEKEIGLTPEQANASFHKSWKKVATASSFQLILEQLVHYFTTYTMERLGIYSKDSVYIPKEDSKIPDVDTDIVLTLIKGYTPEEIKEKLLKLLQTGIALKEDTIKDVIDVATFFELSEEDIETIKNKEVKARMYDYLDIVPKNNIEFLRYLIYKATGSTLIIKNKDTIEVIKSKDNLDILGLINKYEKENGLENLAKIFYRFKPLWLAFRTIKGMKKKINRIRKLAKKYHQPMKEDFLNTVTATIKKSFGIMDTLYIDVLKTELSKVNIFRKIRLAYALKYRTIDVDSIMYRIRNGTAFVKDFELSEAKKIKASQVLDVVQKSITDDIRLKVDRKRILFPANIEYTLPATEKQFTGDIPSGSYVTIPEDMIVGVHWYNYKGNRIDLDLSLTTLGQKFGWDASYRDSGRTVLFSGDITDPDKNKGASELFYVKKQQENVYLLNLNYYNYTANLDVPFKMLVAKEKPKDFGKNYTVNLNNIITTVKSSINQEQMIVGLLVVKKENSKFIFAQTNIGSSISSISSDMTEKAREYLFNYYNDTIKLKDILKQAGARIIYDPKETPDIDLRLERIEKDTIIDLLTR